jgi:hypothetical protein
VTVSVEHDITYKWSSGSTAFQTTRQVLGAIESNLDVLVPNASQNAPNAFSLTLSKSLSIFLLVDQAVILRAGGGNAVQQIAVAGTPTGGSFTATIAGQTATIAYNATAAQVATALNALSAVGANGCTTTGGPLPGTSVNVTFTGLLGLQVLALPTIDNTLLTGGSSPTAAVTTTTAGVVPDTTLSVLANVPLVWDSTGYFAQPFSANVSTISVTNTSGVNCKVKLRTLSNS